MFRSISKPIIFTFLLWCFFMVIDRNGTICFTLNNKANYFSIDYIFLALLGCIFLFELGVLVLKYVVTLIKKDVLLSNHSFHGDKESIEMIQSGNKDKIVLSRNQFDEAAILIVKTLGAITAELMNEARRLLVSLRKIVGNDAIIDILMLKIYKGEKNFDKMEQLSQKLMQNEDIQLVGMKAALEAQISDILMFARSGEQTVSRLDAVDIITETAANLAALTQKHGVKFETHIGTRPMTLLANQTALSGALTNLCANAVEAGASLVDLSLTADARFIYIKVANDGPEIPADKRAQIFEPFYTSKSSGTGLGLAVVRAVAKVHQGEVYLEENEQFKTIFTLKLPRYQRQAAPSESISTAVFKQRRLHREQPETEEAA